MTWSGRWVRADEHLPEGWRYRMDVVVGTPADDVARWWPTNLGRCEVVDAHTTRIVATTDEPDGYACGTSRRRRRPPRQAA